MKRRNNMEVQREKLVAADVDELKSEATAAVTDGPVSSAGKLQPVNPLSVEVTGAKQDHAVVEDLRKAAEASDEAAEENVNNQLDVSDTGSEELAAQIAALEFAEVRAASPQAAIKYKRKGPSYNPNANRNAIVVRSPEQEDEDDILSPSTIIANPLNAANVPGTLLNLDGSLSASSESSYRPTQADEDAQELRQLRAMLDRGSGSKARSAIPAASPYKPRYGGSASYGSDYGAGGEWNSSPHRSVPHSLRGLKPLPGISKNEPWSPDIVETCRRDALPESSRYATAGLSRLDDGMNDSVAQLYHRRVAEEKRIAKDMRRQAWDSTQWMYVPPALVRGLHFASVDLLWSVKLTSSPASLSSPSVHSPAHELFRARLLCVQRGLKPVTKEPWARDQEAYLEGSNRLLE